MNSQFKNSSLGFYLYAIIIVIIAIASIFVFWYMVKGYKLGTYDENTILGSVYLGGTKESEVEAKLIKRIDRWLGDETIVVEATYQGYSYEFDKDLFFFDFDSSFFNFTNGESNVLAVTYQATDRINVFNEISNSEFVLLSGLTFDIDTLINDVLKDAGFMKSFSSKRLEDYIIDEETAFMPIDSVTITIPEGVVIDDFIASINEIYNDSKIMINSKEAFDVIPLLSGSLSDTEMSILSTGMLDLIQETNFSINEIHYVLVIDYLPYNIDTYPYFGHNANINQIIGNGFSFYNPNNSDYYFTLEKADEFTATLTLHGLQFINEIEVEVSKNKIDHITQETVEGGIPGQPGYDGMIIEVNRTVTDINGNIMYDNIILFEFYPPVKEIVLEP